MAKYKIKEGENGVDLSEVVVDTVHTNKEAVVTFKNITYTVQITEGCCRCFRKPKPKKILKDISGVMKQGLNAIMGPTGSGKSSLLDVLAKRKDPKWLTGNVFLNSKKLPQNYKYISGYVVQNDILIPTLTVRECLWFSANLRLPSSIGKVAKEIRISEIIEQLGLQKCSDTKVGNEMVRGISGGERKRTSIGLELITNPSVLFLDEPTTGLDASTANSVMNLLKKLSLQGQTIILSIHQPRFSIYRLFDSLTLLSLGNCLFHGKSSEALPYFENMGYQCAIHNNPADFFLDVINGDIDNVQENDNNNISITLLKSDSKHEREKKISDFLNSKYKSSNFFSDCESQLEILSKESFEQGDSDVHFSDIMYATSFIYQLKHLVKRDFINIIRNPQGILGNIVINIIIGLIFGLIYYQIDNSPTEGTQNRFGVLFFITTNLLFGSINVVDMFIKGRNLFLHEYVSGYYRILAYFLSKVFADLLPMRTMAPLFYSTVTYWMAGLKPEVGSFFTFLLISTLTAYSGVAIGAFFSATFETFSVVSLFTVLVFVFAIVFSGLLANLNAMLSWLSWIRYLSIARYCMVGLSVNEFSNFNFTKCYTDDEITKLGRLKTEYFHIFVDTANNKTCLSTTGENFLMEELSVPAITSWILWQNVVALVCITTGMFALTYTQLVKKKKYS